MRKRASRTIRDPMGWIKARTPLADAQQCDLGIAYHMSLRAMLTGQGSEQAWSTLACALNIAVILCEQGVCAGALQTIQLAQDALISCRKRAHRLGKYAFSGDEARMVMRACAIHDEQVSFSTRGQVVHALEEVNRRIEIGAIA